MTISNKAYLDYAATTPVDPKVVEAMSNYWEITGEFGNASSSQHLYGVNAAQAVEQARFKLAKLIKAKANEIIWTSGATESCNIALRGVVNASAKPLKIITLATEHDAVLQTVKDLKRLKHEVEVLNVSSNGLLDLDKLKATIVKGRSLVSIMWVNNETGVIQDIPKIAKLCKKLGAILHVDAAQALGKVNIDLKKIPIDLMTISSHKVYGPKGIGALYIRSKTKLTPIYTGGGQEKSLRPGTLATPLIVGAGVAFELLNKNMKSENKVIEGYSKQILAKAKSLNGKINGAIESKVPHIINLQFKGVRKNIIPYLKNVAVSNSSACTTTKDKASHVLTAMGLKKYDAISSIRISLGRFVTKKGIDILLKDLEVIKSLSN